MAFLPAASPATGPGAQIPIPDPFGFVGDGIGSLIRGFLRDLVDDFLHSLAEPVLRYVLHTPDLLAEPTLRRLWATSLAALLVLAGLLVGIAGTAMITGSSTRMGTAAREAVGVRLASSLLTAAVSLPVVALEVQLANKLVDALTTAGLNGAADPMTSIFLRHLGGDLGSSFALLVTELVGVVFLVVLTVLGLARWATLWLLIVLAPFAAGLSLLPSGGAAMRAWWRLQVTAVFLPIAHAVLIATYVAMFSSDKTGFVGALAGVATLALMAKLPGWAAGAATGLGSGDVTHRVYRTHTLARRTARTVAAVKTGGASAAVSAALKVASPSALPARSRGAGGGAGRRGSSGGAAPPG
ncbi:MAG TPA: hypothetical protein VFQ85_06175 [Mycobacteriales bacterium]|nr:hypothetical protein [Mycobacteriales bacterium]